MPVRPHIAFARAALLAVLLVLAGCSALPRDVERPPSSALTQTEGTRIGRAVAPLAAARPGLTAVHAMAHGREAFAVRAMLARAAEKSIDVQYYIWHADTSGALLAHALWEAAERGVRVRMLLDDANTGGLDPSLAVLDSHPNIEVRLFNPFANRTWRLGDFASDFSRVNRRMHNKSFTVDNQATVVGGRNIGDEYLGAETSVAYVDLDVLAFGTVVADVSRQFDTYWNSVSAYPASSLMKAADAMMVDEVHSGWQMRSRSPEAARYLEAVRDLQVVPQLQSGTLPVEWVAAKMVADDPGKVLASSESSDQLLLPRIESALGSPRRELLLVSPYFVPGPEGTQALVALVKRGVQVSVLTNSLAVTDVTPVYAAYARYRHDLLEGGVRLFELKPTAARIAEERDRSGSALVPGSSGTSYNVSSGDSLHAKTFAVDRQRIFVGSFNLDPRSAKLNTEMGLVLESTEMASKLSRVFQEDLAIAAYEVRLVAGSGDMEWVERSAGGQEVRHSRTPETSGLRLLWINLLSILPEWLL